VFHVSGDASDRDEVLRWSLVLKVIPFSANRDDPSHHFYWKREVLAYQSGLLDNLPGGLAAPRCFDIVEHPGEGAWMWLEEVTDEIGPQWPLEHYGVVARQFGQFNGAYLVGESLPSWPWLSQGWLRAYVAQAAPAIAQLRSSLEHPLMRRCYPARAHHTFRLWTEREMFLAALDSLPQTLCHLDVFRRNLFARRSADGADDKHPCDQTVVVDWAFVGIGAVGEEIAPLVGASFLFFEVELGQAQELDEIVFEGYLHGLRDAGWRGDPRAVRLGYTAASALRYPIGGLGEGLRSVLDESLHVGLEQTLGRSIEEIMDHLAELGRFSRGLADEARELLDIVQ
jgi:hypothetical protein